MSENDTGSLRTELARHRALADAAFEGLALHDDGVIIDANEAFASMFGYTRDEVVGLRVLSLAAPESVELLAAQLRSGSEEPYEGLARRKDGTRFAVQLRGREVVLAGRRMRATALRDMSDTKGICALVDRVTEVVVALDASFRFTFANRAALELFDCDLQALLGRVVWEMYPSVVGTPFEARLREAMAAQKPAEFEATAPRSRRTIRLRAFPSPEGMTIYTNDVTEQRRLEAQLREAQKLEVIGRLAGGVAHDFNNLLTVILAHTSMLRRTAPRGSALDEGLAELEHAGTRAADITRQLLAFGRRQVLRPRVLDLNELVRSSDGTIRQLVREDIEVRVFLARELGAIEADEAQLEQVLVNLVANARDAMPKGGTLTIETSNVVLDDAYARAHAGVTPGPHVLLSVTDTGIGMDKETAARVFEPFFTTKELGQGTGLGLPTVFGIVAQSRGHVWVYSEPGRGTTFKVYFPRSDAAPAPAEAPSSPRPAAGTETILLVEDEGAVRRLLAKVLRRAGYTVVEAASPAEAIESFAREGADLLLTDVVMPKMNGRQLANELARRAPGLRVVYMSGYTENVIVHGVLDAGVVFMQKPITVDALLRTVRDVLDAKEAPAR